MKYDMIHTAYRMLGEPLGDTASDEAPDGCIGNKH